jgi:hypothetical protein
MDGLILSSVGQKEDIGFGRVKWIFESGETLYELRFLVPMVGGEARRVRG